MRTIYTLDVEDFTDHDPELGYRVTIYEHGEEKSDGVAPDLRAALVEALEGIIPDPERGECDKCEETYDIGSQLDHCTECGTCWSHCDCLSDA